MFTFQVEKLPGRWKLKFMIRHHFLAVTVDDAIIIWCVLAFYTPLSPGGKGSLVFLASSMVKLTEGWLSLSVNRKLMLMLQLLPRWALCSTWLIHKAFVHVEIQHFALVWMSFFNTAHKCILMNAFKFLS